MATFGTRVLTDPVSQWFTNKPVAIVPTDIQRSSVVSVAADSTKDVKGAWTEIIASTSQDTNFLYLSLAGTGVSGSNTGILLDIGIGGSGSEVAVIQNIPCGWLGSMVFDFPFAVSIGSRISARCQAFIASDTVNVQVTTANIPGLAGSNLIETFGAVTTDSRGTNIPGDNTYVQFVSSTSRQYRAIVMIPCLGSSTNPSVAAENSTYTLGIGAAGSEVDVMTFPISTFTSETITPTTGSRSNIYYPQGGVPAGNRIAVKQSVGRTYRDAIIFGVL